MTMDYIFDVAHFSVDRLLENWRWLCPEPFVLLARNVFGDLFLQKESGRVFKLEVSVGQLTEIAESEEQFRRLAGTEETCQEWFAESDASAAQLLPTAKC